MRHIPNASTTDCSTAQACEDYSEMNSAPFPSLRSEIEKFPLFSLLKLSLQILHLPAGFSFSRRAGRGDYYWGGLLLEIRPVRVGDYLRVGALFSGQKTDGTFLYYSLRVSE